MRNATRERIKTLTETEASWVYFQKHLIYSSLKFNMTPIYDVHVLELPLETNVCGPSSFLVLLSQW